MIQAGALIKRVARYLTDFDETDEAYQHVEWSERDLMDYLRLATTLVRVADKSAVTCRKEMPLTGDPFLDLPEGCESLLRIIGYVDASGVTHTNVRLQRVEEDAPLVVNRPVCTPTRSSTGFTVKVDEGAGDVVTVEPSTAGGHLVIVCSCELDDFNEEVPIKLSAKYEPVLFWMMVSMAFGTDIEAVPMRERSDAYWTRAVETLLMLAPRAVRPTRPTRGSQ